MGCGPSVRVRAGRAAAQGSRPGSAGAKRYDRAAMGAERWKVWYDDQCELCQAGLAWLRALDRSNAIEALALSQTLGQANRPAGASDDDLLRHIHVQSPGGEVLTGAPAMAALARLFPRTAWIAWLAMLPGLRLVSRAAYDWLARHRYGLSRCRGGACRSARVDLVRERASWRAFQTCRVAGWLGVTPLAAVAFLRRLGRQTRTWWRTRGRSVELLDGRLSLHFLGGGLSWTVPVLFGELFTLTRYGSLVVDPGGTRMRSSVLRHARRLLARRALTHVFATHAHEEHCGNLEAVAELAGARIHAHPRAMPLLREPARLPAMRALVIGQPRPLRAAVEPLAGTLMLGDGSELVALETPGHCFEHVSLYVPRDRLLLLGDGFMGTHFSTPNDDVDHRAWVRSIERLLELEVEVAVEAHGHVHTRREDVLRDLGRAGLACLATRRDPKELLRAKLG